MSVVSIKKKDLNKRNILDFETWKARENTLYNGRKLKGYDATLIEEKWENPFSLKKYTRQESLELYKEHVLNTPSLFNSLEEIRDKELGCWCKPEICHGDILIELLK